MSEEENRSDRSTHYESDTYSIGAASDLTWEVGTGTDTATTRYLNLPEGVAYAIKIMPTTSVSIVAIDGRDLKSSISVGTGGWSSTGLKVRSIKVQTGAADVVSIEVRG